MYPNYSDIINFYNPTDNAIESRVSCDHQHQSAAIRDFILKWFTRQESVVISHGQGQRRILLVGQHRVPGEDGWGGHVSEDGGVVEDLPPTYSEVIYQPPDYFSLHVQQMSRPPSYDNVSGTVV